MNQLKRVLYVLIFAIPACAELPALETLQLKDIAALPNPAPAAQSRVATTASEATAWTFRDAQNKFEGAQTTLSPLEMAGDWSYAGYVSKKGPGHGVLLATPMRSRSIRISANASAFTDNALSMYIDYWFFHDNYSLRDTRAAGALNGRSVIFPFKRIYDGLGTNADFDCRLLSFEALLCKVNLEIQGYRYSYREGDGNDVPFTIRDEVYLALKRKRD